MNDSPLSPDALDARLAALVRAERSMPGARLWIAGIPISSYSTLAACQHDARTVRTAISHLCEDVIAGVLRRGLAGCPVSEDTLNTLLDTDSLRHGLDGVAIPSFPRERVAALLRRIADHVDLLGQTIAYLLARQAVNAAGKSVSSRN